MNARMRATELERLVIENLLSDRELKPIKSVVDFEAVAVKERNYTGAGFLTEFEPSEALRLFADNVSLRWGKVGARLNDSRVETGYLVYIDRGHITAVEGYTYGDEWPTGVEKIELYELKPGIDLITEPR